MHRTLTQIAAVALVGIGIVLIPGGISWAQSGQGTPTAYKMTIKELCFNTDGSTTFPANLCFVPSTQEFDLAAVAANAIAGSMNFTLATATYKRVRATISCTFGLNGTVTVTGLNYHTTAAGGTLQDNAASPAEGQYKLPDCDDAGADSNKGRNVRTSPVLTLNLGGNVDLVTDVTNGLFLDSGVLRPGNFSISIQTPPSGQSVSQ